MLELLRNRRNPAKSNLDRGGLWEGGRGRGGRIGQSAREVNLSWRQGHGQIPWQAFLGEVCPWKLARWMERMAVRSKKSVWWFQPQIQRHRDVFLLEAVVWFALKAENCPGLVTIIITTIILHVAEKLFGLWHQGGSSSQDVTKSPSSPPCISSSCPCPSPSSSPVHGERLKITQPLLGYASRIYMLVEPFLMIIFVARSFFVNDHHHHLHNF